MNCFYKTINMKAKLTKSRENQIRTENFYLSHFGIERMYIDSQKKTAGGGGLFN